MERVEFKKIGRHTVVFADSVKQAQQIKSLLIQEDFLTFSDPPFDLKSCDVLTAISANKHHIIAGYGINYYSLCVKEDLLFSGEMIVPRQHPQSIKGWKTPFITHFNVALLSKSNPKSHPFDRYLARGKFGKDSYFPSIMPKYENTLGSYQKPLQYALDILSCCHSKYIFDPFLGTATTLKACEILGKTCIGVEIDKNKYEATSL